MIVLLTYYSSLSQVIRFNEQKIQAEQAIYLGGFNDVQLLDLPLDPATKLEVLMMYARSNQNVSKPGLHICLSFLPDEPLSETTILTICQSFLGGIGYVNQPFLVYRPIDKKHIYIQIVTVAITFTGHRIPDAHIRRIANRILQETEISFNLIKAQEKRPPASTDPAVSASHPTVKPS